MTTATTEATPTVMSERFSRTATTPEQFGQIMQELERISKTKVDYISPAKDLHLDVSTARPRLAVDMGLPLGTVAYDLSRIAHEHISDKLSIPLPYYRRMVGEHNALLASDVNYWFQTEPNRHFLIRAIDGLVRALLSSSYRILDSYSLAFAVLDVARDIKLNVQRIDLTDERFYLRLVAPDFVERVDFGPGGAHSFTRAKPGDDVIPGIVISNSEVGRGSLNVYPFIFNYACSNGAWGETKLTQVHLGKRLEAGYLSAETRAKEDEALWGAVRDLTRATFDPTIFRKMIDQMRGAVAQELEHPIEAVDAVVKHYGMSDADKQAILNELIAPQTRDNDPGRTVYGLLQAVTARAKAYDNADESRVFEQAGGDLLTRAPQLVAIRR